jgi:hypothetical protein
MALTDLELAVKTLLAKQPDQKALFDYYIGNQPIRYAADRLREIFANRQTSFVQNWCAVVVDAVLDRLNLPSFDVTGQAALTKRLNEIYIATGLAIDSDAAMRAALITWEGFIVAWRSESEGIEAFYNDPRLCHIWYEAANPRRKRFGAKWWQDEGDELLRLNLYYPTRIEHYVTKKTEGPEARSFTEESTEVNPWGIIPLIHIYRDRWIQTGELSNVLPLQDAINKLLADMMIAAEFGAFPQRWVITNGDISALKNKPNEVWGVPLSVPGEQPVSLGQFDAVNLGNYLDSIDRLATSIAIITRTPKHYLFQGTGQPPSGEALIAMEAPLNRKAVQYQEKFGRGWQELAAFLLLLDSGTVVDPQTIIPQWARAETVQPRTEAEIRKMSVEAGMPLQTTLRREGWTDQELADMEADMTAEAEAEAERRGNIGTELLRDFEAGGQMPMAARTNGQQAREAQGQ